MDFFVPSHFQAGPLLAGPQAAAFLYFQAGVGLGLGSQLEGLEEFGAALAATAFAGANPNAGLARTGVEDLPGFQRHYQEGPDLAAFDPQPEAHGHSLSQFGSQRLAQVLCQFGLEAPPHCLHGQAPQDAFGLLQ